MILKLVMPKYGLRLKPYHMKNYIHTGHHLKALKAFKKIAVGKTFGFETDRIPSSDEVHDLWLKNGKEY